MIILLVNTVVFWGDTICNDYFKNAAALRGSVQNTAAGETFDF